MKRFTNSSMIFSSCETNNWRFMWYSIIMRLTRLLLMMIFRQTSYFFAAALTIEISIWNFFTIKTSRSNFASIFIFLNKNDSNTKTRSFDKEEDEWQKTSSSTSEFINVVKYSFKVFFIFLTNEVNFYMRIFLQSFEIIVRYEDFEYDYLIVQLLCFQ